MRRNFRIMNEGRRRRRAEREDRLFAEAMGRTAEALMRGMAIELCTACEGTGLRRGTLIYCGCDTGKARRADEETT